MLNSVSNLVNTIRDNNEVEFEGATLRMIPGKESGRTLEIGDTYIAERNSGPHLLTVRKSDPRGWIESVENAYSFDWNECVGVDIVL